MSTTYRPIEEKWFAGWPSGAQGHAEAKSSGSGQPVRHQIHFDQSSDHCV